MNQFLKKVFILFTLVGSVTLFAQDDIFGEKRDREFKPKFTLGSGIYTLTGDIQNEETGLLKGKSGFNAGMKFDILNNLDLSFLFITTSLSGDNGSENFSSDLDGFGLHLGYTINQIFERSKISPRFSLGFQKLGASTIISGVKKERANVIAMPLAFGVRMDITERLQFDITMNFGMGMSDVDMSEEDNSDGYKSLNFVIHYDLFTPGKNARDNDFDDSYYADVDFSKLELEDEDGDLVRDMDDYCPKTPAGVQVDKNGCPLDDDKDGIANYLDKQKDTPVGSVVDENGVRLTIDKYKSMYSDLEIASRRYANFYNENEIKRENYKTVDEYLIAKANAFNKAYNESLNDDSKVKALIYKVKIGEFNQGIPPKIANKLLSIDDLESFSMDNDVVIYAVGSYANLEEAMSRSYHMEDKGFKETYILVDNNGEISNYVDPTTVSEVSSEEEVDNIETAETDMIVTEIEEPTNEATYRIQIGAFNTTLPSEIFVGVDNVISFTGKDGLVRYMTGSFAEYTDAVDYQAQMRARGFEDAFIVTYKDGERISLNIAIESDKKNWSEDLPSLNNMQKNDSSEVIIELRFTVQILVSEASLSAENLQRMSSLGDFDKKAKGSDMYEYYAGTYVSLEEANIQLAKAKSEGFSDAFIFATSNGERITLEEARELLK
tara:strand:- start:1881 stop:3875 length:1995 start_codon:yes stop_codon:yes gene_type:complete